MFDRRSLQIAWGSWAFAWLLAGAAARGEIMPVELLFVPPSPTANKLDLTLTVTVPQYGVTSSDSQSPTVAGAAMANLTVGFNAATQTAVVTGLEFTGGRFQFSDTAFGLVFGPWGMLGQIDVTGTGIAGTLDTPMPPGPVGGGQFAADQHTAILNEGTVYATGTGVVGSLFEPTTIDLAADPIPATSQGTGLLIVGPPAIQGGTASYDVTLDLPVDFDQQIYDESGVIVRMAGKGTFRATGRFTRAIPVFGDFDWDGAAGPADIALLWQHIPSADPAYDLDGSGAADRLDMDTLIRQVLGSEYGDADLDGDVDVEDYLTMKARYGAVVGADWGSADFDGDGDADRADLLRMKEHFGWHSGQASSPAGAAVPEPAGCLLLAAGAATLLRRRRR